MKHLSITALVIATVLALGLWAPIPASAQTPIQRGRTVDLLFYSTAGASTVSFGATYPFSFIFDGTLNYTSAAGTSDVDLGIRYWFPVTAAGLEPYVGGGISFLSSAGVSQTGFFLGGGAAVGLAPQWNGYVGINLLSAGGTSTTTFNVGAQYVFSSHVGGVVGLIGSSGSTSAYIGVTLGY